MNVAKHIISVLLFIMTSETQMIYDFSKENNTEAWQIVNDGVMGGLSESSINLTEDGHAVFSGHVSLANNGGFTSVRHLTSTSLESESERIILKVKGDGKTYQFRLKSDQNQNQSYVHEFKTNGEWQIIKLNIKEFSPQYRGRKLEIPNFNFSKIEEVRFLIANKKEQDFKLLIDYIAVE